jgi:predicted acylesterase/phospholipase RssA
VNNTEKPRIALCLSGGGLRATFFHLGVVRYLAETGLLAHTTTICSVSGGSILAAHLVQRWREYTSSLADFDRAANQLVRFGLFDLRGRIVRRWLLSIIIFPVRLLPKRLWARTEILRRYYDARLFNGATLRTLQRHEGGAVPELHILATSLTTGGLCSFNDDGFWIDNGKQPKFIRSGLLPISLAVAASSAFPPLFPPVVLSRKTLNASEEELPYDTENLTDGGVFDNLGLRKMHRLHESRLLDVDLIISSDAGAGFDWNVSGSFSSVISRTVRTTDILMKRVGDFEKQAADSGPLDMGAPILSCDIRSVVSPAMGTNVSEDVQIKIPRIRTDLDRFAPEEIAALTQHGYAVAATICGDFTRQLALKATPRDIRGVWTPPTLQKNNHTPEQLATFLNRSRTRRLGLWNPRDWTSWALAAVAVLVPSLVAASLFFNAAVVKNNFVAKKTNEVSIVGEGFRNASSETVTPFKASSGQVNVGCDSTASGRVDWHLPSGAVLDGPLNAVWVNTDNLSSFSASPVPYSDSLVGAQGLIRGLNSQALPFGIRNCPGGGHGELVLTGNYRVRSVQRLPVQYPLSGMLSDKPLTFTLPSEQDVALNHIAIDISGDGNPPRKSSISIPMAERKTEYSAQSKDGQFEATVDGTKLIIMRKPGS